MSTVFLHATPPADMPIWARLRLIACDIPFAHVAEWRYERPNLISIITIHGGYTVVTRDVA